MNNPNCDGGRCKSATGEVRVYPLGGGGNLILCATCWAYENRYGRATHERSEGNMTLVSDYDRVTPREWAEYEFATIEYDYRIPAPAAKAIRSILDRLAKEGKAS